MHYDQSWMGYGFIGGLQAGMISAIVGMLLFGVFHWLGRRNGWSYGPQISWAFLLTTLLTASGDLWDLLYFNYAQMQSLQLLRRWNWSQVHDADGIGTCGWRLSSVRSDAGYLCGLGVVATAH